MNPLCPECNKLMDLLWRKTWYFKGEVIRTEDRYCCYLHDEGVEKGVDWSAWNIPAEKGTGHEAAVRTGDGSDLPSYSGGGE